MYRRGGELLEVTTSQPRGGRGRLAGIVPADSVKRDKASYIIMFGDFVSAIGVLLQTTFAFSK